MLELAAALEVNVGAVGMQRKKLPGHVQEVHVVIEFLDTKSVPSRSIKVDPSDSITSLSFASRKCGIFSFIYQLFSLSCW